MKNILRDLVIDPENTVNIKRKIMDIKDFCHFLTHNYHI